MLNILLKSVKHSSVSQNMLSYQNYSTRLTIRKLSGLISRPRRASCIGCNGRDADGAICLLLKWFVLHFFGVDLKHLREALFEHLGHFAQRLVPLMSGIMWDSLSITTESYSIAAKFKEQFTISGGIDLTIYRYFFSNVKDIFSNEDKGDSSCRY